MFKKSLLVLLYSVSTYAHAGFDIVTLGSKGGIQDGNLTAFLLKDSDEQNYIALDAGTIINGLIVADQQQAFKDLNVPPHSPYTKIGYLLREKIKGYFISHAHLDHLAGMIIASPDDSHKNIYGLASVNDTITETYFNWKAWPNFGNRGQGYQLGKYNYTDLSSQDWLPIKNTNLQVKALPLSHAGVESSAFIIKNNQKQIVAYLGDTGADRIEKSDLLNSLWSTLTPYIKNKQLKGIMIETSFSNDVAERSLYGHLTPKLLLEELTQLENKVGDKGALTGLPIVITHIKYSLLKQSDPQTMIQQQLNADNNIGVIFHFPAQGNHFQL
ncbi:MBL fold metallo-hydrolase [Photobacterium carnosum]|uniref:MBL fold metallo-hydrolase n=1 Tax=Photobacterium carnosum TaxID=2023717 RepID=UPI001E318F22|nr:3',5'-cyclic-nucleotide phosphodiesterase [Photobacterium carnosum]MCD9529159.1 3',5'-cyclic-nucleotide phosphodiesterase [Photobacterium carnosum]MCF2154014.1 3',5'-cyclic-nucleotide phosphodiesterase [Photobacterium carnosum]MCF2215730.1 3',5'-cyclic-nucleotide phosphodiesterase [Photobacterium carnosum]